MFCYWNQSFKEAENGYEYIAAGVALVLVALCSGNKKGGGVFETDCLAADPTDADEVNMYFQKGYSIKYTSGPLSSLNPPISVA